MNEQKEIYASIEIGDHEVRLVAGEFYETRFHILRVERCELQGIEHKLIVDEQAVVAAIRKAVHKVEEVLGFPLHRVLLALPSMHVERHTKRVQVVPQVSSKRIRLSDIQGGLNQAIAYKPSDDLELVNVGCIKYITGGITSRKMPLDEVSELLTMSVDLLYADKEIVYSYARCIEKAGLEILDVCLDSYAIANEAAVFEQIVDKYVILVNLARQDTTLSLFSHGKLVNSEILHQGYGEWLKPFHEECGLSAKISYRLLQNTCTFDEARAKDNVIYIWSVGNEQKQLTEKAVCKRVMPSILAWIKTVNEACESIVENGDVRYLISGEGCEIASLSQVLSAFNAPAQMYVPQTIGARNPAYVACLGLFYCWKEQQAIRHDERTSCESDEVNEALHISPRKNTVDEGGFTKRLKSILLNDK